MKHLLFMSLLSILFGCGKSKKTNDPEPWPYFPENDASGVVFEPVELDSAYIVQGFFIPENKQHVYVLAFNHFDGQTRLNTEKAYTLYRLSPEGRIERRLEFKKLEYESRAAIGQLGDQLLVRMENTLFRIDPESWRIAETIPLYWNEYFPPLQECAYMTPGQQWRAYPPAFEKAYNKAAKQERLKWHLIGEEYALLYDAKGRRSAWILPDEEDGEFAVRKLDSMEIKLNPGSVTPDSGLYQITDGDVSLYHKGMLSLGTQLDYPNYKLRQASQYELKAGGRTVRFATRDKSRRDLYPLFADNRYLCTADGAVWIGYEGVLYRWKGQ